MQARAARRLIVRAIPLDESVIRLLHADSYRALRELQAEQAGGAIAAARRATAVRQPESVVRLVLRRRARRALQPDGAGHHQRRPRFPPARRHPAHARLRRAAPRQRETQSALYVFDERRRPQPAARGDRSEDTERGLGRRSCSRIERERALVRVARGRTLGQLNDCSLHRQPPWLFFRSARSLARPAARVARRLARAARRCPRGAERRSRRASAAQTLAELTYPEYASDWETAVEDERSRSHPARARSRSTRATSRSSPSTTPSATTRGSSA